MYGFAPLFVGILVIACVRASPKRAKRLLGRLRNRLAGCLNLVLEIIDIFTNSEVEPVRKRYGTRGGTEYREQEITGWIQDEVVTIIKVM